MSASPLKVEIHSDAEGFSTLAPEWKNLLQHNSTRSLFLTPQWQALWWEHFGAGRPLCLASARDGEGQLVGLAPLFLWEEGRLGFVGEMDLCDYLDVLSLSGQEEDVARAILKALAERISGESVLDLHFIPGASRMIQALSAAGQEAGWAVEVAEEETAPLILLPATWEEYLQGLSGKDRHELRRKIKRMKASGELELERASTAEEAKEFTEVFLRFHALSHTEKAKFMGPAMQAFFRVASERIFDLGWLRMSKLNLQGKPVAALFSFDYDGAVLVYNSGYDPAVSHLSPGISIFGLSILEAIRDKKRAFHFLRGDEAYKYRLGAKDQPLFRVRLTPPGRGK